MNLKDRLEDIRRRMTEGSDAMKAILDKADNEKRSVTDEETAAFDYLGAEVDRLKKDEEMTRRALENEDKLTKPVSAGPSWTPAIVKKPGSPEEFKSFGEFLYAVRFQPQDERLNFVEIEKREQSMGIGVEGGYAVPTQFSPQLKSVMPQEAVIRPRASVIPAGSPPDAAISMPVLNQTAAQNIYGGVEVTWVTEGGTKSETDLRIKEVTLTPHEVAAYIVVTDKLLRNWQAADGLISTQLRKAIIGAEDTAFLTGSGVGRPLGITNSNARINIARTTANQIAFADVYAMYARAKFGGNLVWVGSQTILPQLIAMVDTGTNSVWLPGGTSGAANPPPGSLFGIPLVFNERSPALGSTGDLMLLDLSYYLIKDGSGPFVAASPHVYFTSNKTVIKAFWNVDGQPWLDAAIPLEGSTANTVSPFVVLN